MKSRKMIAVGLVAASVMVFWMVMASADDDVSGRVDAALNAAANTHFYMGHPMGWVVTPFVTLSRVVRLQVVDKL